MLEKQQEIQAEFTTSIERRDAHVGPLEKQYVPQINNQRRRSDKLPCTCPCTFLNLLEEVRHVSQGSSKGVLSQETWEPILGTKATD